MHDDFGNTTELSPPGDTVLGLGLRSKLARIAHRQITRPRGAVVGFDDDKGFVFDAEFFVLALELDEQRIGRGLHAIQARRCTEVDLAASPVHGVDQPGVHAQELGKAFCHFFIVEKVR